MRMLHRFIAAGVEAPASAARNEAGVARGSSDRIGAAGQGFGPAPRPDGQDARDST